MLLGVTRRIAVGRALAVTAALLATVTATGAAGASQSHRSAAPQHRQIGVAELTGFKVVLIATRGTGQPPTATVTAAGYRRSRAGWTLIAVKRIGGVDQWFWYAVDTCSLDITQFQAGSPVRNVDSIKVSLLATPALGCTKPFSEHWKP
jgi:ABC-type amino acid transport substrate-binding protein